MNKNCRQVCAEYTEALLAYLEALRQETRGLPARAGKVSVAAVALASGLEQQSLYKNLRCRELLEHAAQELDHHTQIHWTTNLSGVAADYLLFSLKSRTNVREIVRYG